MRLVSYFLSHSLRISFFLILIFLVMLIGSFIINFRTSSHVFLFIYRSIFLSQLSHPIDYTCTPFSFSFLLKFLHLYSQILLQLSLNLCVTLLFYPKPQRYPVSLTLQTDLVTFTPGLHITFQTETSDIQTLRKRNFMFAFGSLYIVLITLYHSPFSFPDFSVVTL